MEYFKIFSIEKQQWWQQGGFGYTDEHNAGFWPGSTIKRLGLDESQQIVPFEPSRLTQALIAQNLYEFGNLGTPLVP